jgi:DNA mismatch repair protein MutS
MSAHKKAGGTTPLAVQYNQIKDLHPDKLVFYRMGDFYELFGEDAKVASRILGITLTSRAQGKESERIPLAGVPHHSAEKYLSRLLAAGRKVVICEQTEDPKHAKGLVRREVVEILTPGTPTLTVAGDERPLVALAVGASRWGAASLEFSTGRFEVVEGDRDLVEKWLSVARPSELLFSDALDEAPPLSGTTHLTEWADLHFRYEEALRALVEQFQTRTLAGFGLGELRLAVSAAGGLISYVRETKKTPMDHITHLRRVDLDLRMFLDADTIAHLELLEARDSRHPETSLYYQVNRTVTGMGERLLRRTLVAPYASLEDLQPRLSATDYLVTHPEAGGAIRNELDGLPDFERIAGRIGFGRANPRELVALANGLNRLPELIRICRSTELEFVTRICEELPDLSGAAQDIAKTLRDDPPVVIHQGGLIREGVSQELSDLRRSISDSKSYLANLQAEERERTGIATLKVGYNKIFGYYIEVTHVHRDSVPHHYVRKQTLVGAERYITDALKSHEERVTGAEERIFELEERIFLQLRDRLRAHARELQATGEGLAAIDLVSAWADLARERRYTRPVLVEHSGLSIVGGRHPVVEQVVAAGRFVGNDTDLTSGGSQVHIITGPNMAGKSTYLRQVGLIVLLAQCGSFVPAASAEIGLVDRVFTRVGASDQLALGRSTFLVEMEEAANILHHCTDRSLVLLDEIGRGTSTYDGLSIAWAIAEYLHETEGKRPRTLFATHYHELTALADLYPHIRNFQVVVKRHGDRIIFLHEIRPGGCDDSYGIAVARLAGLPPEVVGRAKEILLDLESGDFNPERLRERASPQRGLFTPTPDPLVVELSEQATDSLSPLEALNRLAEYVARAKLRLDRN